MGVFEEVLESSGKPKTGLFAFLQHNATAKPTPSRVSQTSMTSHLWELEVHPASSLDNLTHDIEALVERSLDTNCFFEPAALSASWPRMAQAWAPNGVQFLHLYETTPLGRSLRLFMPVTVSSYRLTRVKALRALSHDTAPDGVPLIDAENSNETCEMLLQLLGDEKLKLPKLLDLTHQRRNSKSFSMLLQAAKNLGLVSAETNSFERAVLTSQCADFSQLISKKKRKEYTRQLHRLEDKGDLTFHVAHDPQSVLDEMDCFLSLEQATWKRSKRYVFARSFTALRFSRQMVLQMAEKRASTIYSMKLNGFTIASLIVLGKNGRYVTWKIAYAETLSKHSPGVQVMMFASRDLAARKDFQYADSLAYANHPMIDHLWRERLSVVDLGIALDRNFERDLAKITKAKQRLQWIKGRLRKFRKRQTR